MKREDLQRLPDTPGVYQYINADDTIIYIGKAKNLKKRVRSYFGSDQSQKTTRMLAQAVRVRTITTRSEVEALILENQLINQHKPKYNILLRENKRYAWIRVTDETYPRVLTARNKEKKGTYFGPYTDGSARRKIIQFVNKTFQLRTCNTLPNKVCLQYHIGNCTGPCEGFDDQESYMRRVQEALQVLKGDTKPLTKKLQVQMREAASNQNFEKAKKLRDTIHALEKLTTQQVVNASRSFDQDIIAYADDGEQAAVAVIHINRGVMSTKDEYMVTSTPDIIEDFLQAYYETKTPPREIITHGLEDVDALEKYLSNKVASSVEITQPQRGDKKELLGLAKENAEIALSGERPELLQLQETLHLSTPPLTIDCFDVSNQQSDAIVAACVRYQNAQPEPTKYRRFNITSTDTQDDYAAMREAVRRRYSNGDVPDLIVIDGGKGQLSAAQKGLADNNLTNPIISLAKQEEEVFVPGLSQSLPISQDNAGLLLLRRIRDAVHRFVITYHRGKRRKQLTRSALDHIQGIGPKRKQELYAHFKTFENITHASKKDLQEVLGEKTGAHVYAQLHEK